MNEVTYVTKEEAGRPQEKKSAVVDRELGKLYEKEGSLSPALILARAKSPKNALHKFFEWDDSKAGEKFRIIQANEMLMASRYIALLNGLKNETSEGSIAVSAPAVRRFLPSLRGQGFKMRNEVLDESKTRNAFISKKKSELLSWVRSVVDIEEFAKLRQVITKALEKQ